jgi:hypothetical protein
MCNIGEAGMWLKLALVFVMTTTPVLADEKSGELSGSFGFYGEKCEKDSKAAGCVMTFVVRGEAAKALYDRIKWKAQPHACSGGQIKDSRNGMRCYKVNDEYACDFGYSFLQQQMTHSDVTC